MDVETLLEVLNRCDEDGEPYSEYRREIREALEAGARAIERGEELERLLSYAFGYAAQFRDGVGTHTMAWYRRALVVLGGKDRVRQLSDECCLALDALAANAAPPRDPGS